jgi:arginine/lysine/ornithine decarboxylase
VKKIKTAIAEITGRAIALLESPWRPICIFQVAAILCFWVTTFGTFRFEKEKSGNPASIVPRWMKRYKIEHKKLQQLIVLCTVIFVVPRQGKGIRRERLMVHAYASTNCTKMAPTLQRSYSHGDVDITPTANNRTSVYRKKSTQDPILRLRFTTPAS